MDPTLEAIYLTILRLFHIFAGIVWVGSGIYTVAFLSPTVQALGADGGKFMQTMYLRTSLERAFVASSILTTVAGVLLYERVSGGFSADFMRSGQGIVLSIGSVAGLLAFGHGAAVMGRLTGQFVALAKTLVAADGPPSDGDMTTMSDLIEKMQRHGNISLVLALIAVAGMAGARYFSAIVS